MSAQFINGYSVYSWKYFQFIFLQNQLAFKKTGNKKIQSNIFLIFGEYIQSFFGKSEVSTNINQLSIINENQFLEFLAKLTYVKVAIKAWERE